MNRSLANVDLSRFLVDEQGFLGQTLKLGIEYGLLPDNADEALRMYLQSHTMAFGQRNRTGIAVRREAIEQGGYQATVSLELGLRDQAEGDPNRGAEILANGDFESVRKRGWELAFFRLEAMEREADLFPKRRESGFLLDYADAVRQWSHTEKETWLCTDPESDEEEQIADPIGWYETFLDLTLRIDLLRALPPDELKRYGSANGGRAPFPDLLRNLILSLAAGSQRLVAEETDLEAFADLAQNDPRLTSRVREHLSGQLPAETPSGARERFLLDVGEAFEVLGGGVENLREQVVWRRG